MNSGLYVGTVIAGCENGKAVHCVPANQLPAEFARHCPMGVLMIENSGRMLFKSSNHGFIPNNKTVISHLVLSSTQSIDASSAAKRAAAGGFLFGTVGLMAGFTAKNKERYNVQVTWGDGSTSVIELKPEAYNVFLTCM